MYVCVFFSSGSSSLASIVDFLLFTPPASFHVDVLKQERDRYQVNGSARAHNSTNNQSFFFSFFRRLAAKWKYPHLLDTVKNGTAPGKGERENANEDDLL